MEVLLFVFAEVKIACLTAINIHCSISLNNQYSVLSTIETCHWLVLDSHSTKGVLLWLVTARLILPGINLFVELLQSVPLVNIVFAYRAGGTAWVVDDKSPISFAKASSTVVWGCEERSWHWPVILVNFSIVRTRVIFTVSVINPTNSFFCVGSRTDFLIFIIKLECLSRKINISLLIRIPSKVLPVIRM